MKTHDVTLVAAALITTLFLPSNVHALKKDRSVVEQDRQHRKVMHYSLAFEECEDLTLEECEETISRLVRENPVLFGNRDHLDFHIQRKRLPGDSHYNRVGLMTNMAGTGVVGLNGDGIIKFSNPNFDGKPVWCQKDTPCPHNRNHIVGIDDMCCFNIGPWDCDKGVTKSPEECCNMILTSEPEPDYLGNYLECHTVYPLGSEQNPTNYDRVTIRVGGNGRVLGSPVNE